MHGFRHAPSRFPAPSRAPIANPRLFWWSEALGQAPSMLPAGALPRYKYVPKAAHFCLRPISFVPGAQPGVQVCSKNSSYLLENRHFEPTQDQEPSQQSRSVLQIAHYCLRTASLVSTQFLLENSILLGPNRTRCPARRPGLYKKNTDHFCLRTASFVSTQDQEPSQGSRSVLQTAHFCLRTASFESKQGQKPSQGPGLY